MQSAAIASDPGLGNSVADSEGDSGTELGEASPPPPQSAVSSDDKTIDMSTGLAAAKAAIDVMNRNEFLEAEEMLKPWINKSMYHSTAYSTILFLQAVFSMEQADIERAVTSLTETVALCNTQRRSQGMMEMVSSWIFGTRMDSYSPEELQAEILYAESNLLLALITVLQDESLLNFIRSGLKIRSSYSLYKQLYQWLETCEKDGIELEPNFATGIRMGMGTFNLFLSHLPPRAMKLLEFAGFSGEKECGLQLLEEAAASTTFRGSLSTSFLLTYYTVISVIFGGGNMETDHCEDLLQTQLLQYPNSAQFLYFKGRIELMKGNVDEAITWFQKVQGIRVEWKQISHICWWELMWCHWLGADWLTASSYAEKLYHNSKWSKSIFLYQRVSSLLMLRPTEGRVHLLQADPSHKLTADITCGDLLEMIHLIPVHKRVVAGKRIAIEKFVVEKSQRYLQQNTQLPLPALEILYVWNGFRLLARNPGLLHNMTMCVQKELTWIEENQETNSCYNDDWCVVTLLQGVCFRAQRRLDEAQHCFEEISERSGLIKHDHYVLAAARMELAFVYIDQGRLTEAEELLLTTKNNYKGYHLESRINLRIHAGLSKITRLKNPELCD